jgi:single-strand DNA-binding protein
MASYNKVILIGNLTREPELRVTASGLSICKLSLAVNRSYTTKDGEKQEEVAYIDVDSFGRQAETIAKYLSKGNPLLVDGRLKLDSWESKEGEKRSKLGVVLESFTFLGGGGDGNARQAAPVYRPTVPQNEMTQISGDNYSKVSAANDIEEEAPPF